MSYYDDLVLADGARSYWQLDETSGANANDSNSTNNNDGTYVGTSLASAAGAVDADSAPNFPGGTGAYVTVPDANSLDLLDTMTFECWVKRAATGAVMGLMHKTGANGPDFRFHSDDRIRMTRNGTNIVASTTTITDTTSWHHLVMTKATTAVKLYIDGVDVTGTVGNLALSNTANAFLIGAVTTTTLSFNGLIQKVAVYPTALTPTQVLDHYNVGVLRLAGSSAGQSTVTGGVTISRPLEGSSAGTGTATGDMGVAWILDGTSTGEGTATGDLTLGLRGESTGVGDATGDLTVTLPLAASSAGVGITAGDLGISFALAGSSTGVGTASATIGLIVPEWSETTDSQWVSAAAGNWSQGTSGAWPEDTSGNWPQDTDTNWS